MRVRMHFKCKEINNYGRLTADGRVFLRSLLHILIYTNKQFKIETQPEHLIDLFIVSQIIAKM